MARGERTRVKLGAWSVGQGLRVNGALEGQEQPEGLPGTTASNRAHFSVTQGVFGGTAGGGQPRALQTEGCTWGWSMSQKEPW